MVENKGKKEVNYNLPICAGAGLVFGILLNQIVIGLCLGIVVGFVGNKKKK